jgi:hypothetical protein
MVLVLLVRWVRRRRTTTTGEAEETAWISAPVPSSSAH